MLWFWRVLNWMEMKITCYSSFESFSLKYDSLTGDWVFKFFFLSPLLFFSYLLSNKVLLLFHIYDQFLFYYHRVRYLISDLILRKLKYVQENCQIPLLGSVNLVGAYDPTRTLQEGQVFVCINNGTKGGLVEVGTVLVMRNPCMHPGKTCGVILFTFKNLLYS